jgi:hypothetical protein
MANMDLVTSTGAAAVAYQNALNQARNATNSLIRQFGFTRPDASGNYSVEAFQNAFDPNKLMNKETGTLDEAALGNLVSGISVGGTGVLSDIARSGASTEAEMAMESRSRGLGTGGLAAQRRGLAEAQTAGEMGSAKSQFIANIAQNLAPIGSAWQGLQTGMAEDEAAKQAALALQGSASSPVADVVVPAATSDTPTAAVPSAPQAKAPKKGDKRTTAAGWLQYYNGTKWISTRKVR